MTIQQGVKSVVVNVIPVNDGVGEGNENIVLNLETESDYSLITTVAKQSATVNIADAQPVLTIAAPKNTASELTLSKTGQITITRSGDLSQALTVQLQLDGTAVENTDYILLANNSVVNNTVLIPIHAKSVTITVAAIDNHTANVPNLNLSMSLVTDIPYFFDPAKKP